MRKFFIVAVSLVAAVSCQKDNLEPKPAGRTVSIKATVEQQVSTKTALFGDTVVWSEADAIAVFGTDKPDASSTFTYSGTAGDVEGNFTGTEVSGTMVAVYPQSIVAEGAGLVSSDGKYSIPVTIPAEQSYVEDSFSNNANVAVAVGADALQFKNVMSVLKLQLYGTTARTITKVQLAAAEPLCGEATLSVANDGTEPQLVFDEAKSSKVLTLNVPSISLGTDEAAPSTFYFVVPANALTSGFTISVENTASNDTFYALAKTETDNTTIRSIITEMPVKSVSFSVSKKSLANTIICVPGESVNIYPIQPVTGNLLGHADAVSALGYSFTNADNRGSFSNYTSGYAKYTSVTDNKGYYICGLKDFDGKTLWSWTVWVTEIPGDLTLVDGSVIMDRNLCAKAGERAEDNTYKELRGCLYQWGRKDPLFNYSTNFVESSTETGTLAYAIENPLKFIIAAADQPNAGDWLWEKNNNLWGTTKTEYDPCPAGYKVPDGSADTSFWLATDMVNKASAYDKTYYGYDFSVLDDDTAFFLGGYYCGLKDGVPTGYTNGYYWCCNSVKMTNGAYYGRVFKFVNSSITGKSTLARQYGAQIRCQKIL